MVSHEELVTEKKNLFDELNVDIDDDVPQINDHLDDLVSDEEMKDIQDNAEQDEESVHEDAGSDDGDVTTNIGDSESRAGPTYDMNLLTQRIKDSLLILGDFKKRAPAGMTRKACVDTLLNNLCQRYSYNRFVINILYDLFPKEVC